MSAIYNRPIVTHLNHMELINAAYRAAGIAVPSLGTEVRALISAAQDPKAVASQLAKEALTVENPDEWHKDAVNRIREAEAAFSLKTQFNGQWQHIARAALPDYLATATEELQAPFNKLAKTFSDAVAKLPAGTAALDAEAVIVADAGAALNTVRDCLARFTKYAGMFADDGRPGFPIDLKKIMPIVDLPTPVVEKVGGLGPTTFNEHELTETRAIRKMATDIRRLELDQVLVGIVRGEYGKASLALATPATMEQRFQNATKAHERERVTV